MAAVRDSGTRQDTWVVRLVVAGENFGIWDKKTGGEIDSDETKFTPGGMRPAVSLGGRVTPGNVTLQRMMDRRDDWDRLQTLINGTGKMQVTISQKPMDFDGNEYGHPLVYVGKLKRVSPSDVDSESSTVALYEIEVSIAAPPAVI